MGIRSLIHIFVILALFSANLSFAQGKQVTVIGGQELLLYPKSKAALGSFATSVSRLTIPFGASPKATLLGPKIAVAAFGASSNAIKKVRESDLLAACDRISNAKVGCEINHVVSLYKTADDTFYSSLYGIKKIGSEAAWEFSTGSRSVKVAVIDTGVDYAHPDLAANISVNSAEIPSNGIDDDSNGRIDDYYGYDFVDNDSNPADDNDHGTHVAGTIGAVGNNANGVVGVNWEVGIIPVKVLSASGSGSLAGVVAGVDYAVSRGAHVINLSLGGPDFSSAFFAALERASNAGVLIAAAAGNENSNNDSVPAYPANYNLPTLISIASSTSTDTRSSFSNYGASVHLAAPGSSIHSTLPGGTYGTFSGTSMATPHVAGAAALVKAANSALSMLQIKDILLNNVDQVAALSGLVSTSGRLNVNRAVAAALGTTPLPDPTPTPQPTPDNGGGGGGGGVGDSPDEGDDGDEFDPEPDSTLTFLDVSRTVKGSKASIVSLALDEFDFGLSDVTMTLTCAKKLVATKISNEDGEAVFVYKLKAKSANCVLVAVSSDEITTLKKSFKIKKAEKRKRSSR